MGQHNIDIEKMICTIEEKKYRQAIEELKDMIRIDSCDYQLYYLLGISYDSSGYYEDAYYAYKFAAYLCRGTEEQELLQKAEVQAKARGLNGYKSGKALEALAEYRMECGEYDKTYEFLGEQLYPAKEEPSLKWILSEENMLCYMMLEIVLCEKNNMLPEEYECSNTIKVYGGSIHQYKEVYTRIKFMIRRCWFGFAQSKIDELFGIMEQYTVSAHMLAVIIKYAVPQKYWLVICDRLICTLKSGQYIRTAKVLQVYENMFRNMGGEYASEVMIIPQRFCYAPVRLDYAAMSSDIQIDTAEGAQQTGQDEKKLSIIFCTNDELYAEECIEYLNRLMVPDGMTIQVIEVWNAPGMAAGYNCAMQYSNAKYKLYIHHDTFIIKEDALIKTIDLLEKDKEIGIAGIVGTVVMPRDCMRWIVPDDQMKLKVYQDVVLEVIESYSTDESGALLDCEGLDGIYLATGYDYPWREDLFDHWHFYDMSQCFEFRKHGKRTVFLQDTGFWVMHETTQRKDPKDNYLKYCRIFAENYLRAGNP